MSKKIAIATAAVIVMAASVSSASARSYGHHQSYSSHSCYTKTIKVPAWKTVWRWKKVRTSCGWEKRKVRHTVKVWRTKYKRVCH